MKTSLIIILILLLFCTGAQAEGMDMPEVTAAAAMTGTPVTETDDIAALLTAGDWMLDGSVLRFNLDGSITDPEGGETLFQSYTVEGGKLYLDSAETAGQMADVYQTDAGVDLVFDPQTSEYALLSLTPYVPVETTMAPELTATPMVTPIATVPMFDVVTPTPMAVSFEDASILTILTQGLWKPLGSDGTTYYQFLADGTLLTIQKTPYTVSDGMLQSDVLSGEVLLGGNTAFTLQEGDDKKGYVLNRNSNSVQAEEFITPTPSPTPTPTPSPTPTPTPTPTPSPTPSPTPTPTPSPTPTPTLSPIEEATLLTPELQPVSATFEKRRSLNVYSAPSDVSYRDSNAQVTTNDSVVIYGVVDDWVLVSYPIGYNNTKGRVGYIKNTTLFEPEFVQKLEFADFEMTLLRTVAATDDPNYGAAELIRLQKGDTVTLLAFLRDEWAYVETVYQGKQIRVFIRGRRLFDKQAPLQSRTCRRLPFRHLVPGMPSM